MIVSFVFIIYFNFMYLFVFFGICKGTMDDAGMNVTIGLTAAHYGALMCNHVEVRIKVSRLLSFNNEFANIYLFDYFVLSQPCNGLFLKIVIVSIFQCIFDKLDF